MRGVILASLPTAPPDPGNPTVPPPAASAPGIPAAPPEPPSIEGPPTAAESPLPASADLLFTFRV